jgi:toxin ParE1/3/4
MTPRHDVLLTDAALADLSAIALHIASSNPARALSFIDELEAACQGLADTPERFAIVPRYEAMGVRRRVHGNYLIFYRVCAPQVEVLHILHGAMDHDAVLFPSG